jgi:hypothetical protein
LFINNNNIHSNTSFKATVGKRIRKYFHNACIDTNNYSKESAALAGHAMYFGLINHVKLIAKETYIVEV